MSSSSMMDGGNIPDLAFMKFLQEGQISYSLHDDLHQRIVHINEWLAEHKHDIKPHTTADSNILKAAAVRLTRICFEKAQEMDLHNQADIRWVAVRLLELAYSGRFNDDEQSIISYMSLDDYTMIIHMALRAGKVYLDAWSQSKSTAEAFNPVLLANSAECFAIGLKYHALTEKHGIAIDTETSFTLHTWASEMEWQRENYKAALQHVDKACTYIAEVPSEFDELNKSIFRHATALFEVKDCDSSLSWFRRSEELCKAMLKSIAEIDPADNNTLSENYIVLLLEKTLHAISVVYIEQSDWESALEAAEQTLTISSHTNIDALSVKCKALLVLERCDEAAPAIAQLIKHNNCSLDLALGVCEYVGASPKYQLLLLEEAYNMVDKRHPNMPQIWLSRLKILMDRGRAFDALKLIDEILYSGGLDETQRAKLKNQIWSQIVRAFESGKHDAAVELLDRYKRLIHPDDSDTLCKLERAYALISFEQGNYLASISHATNALAIIPQNTATMAVLVRGYIAAGKENDAVTKLSQCLDLHKFSNHIPILVLIAEDSMTRHYNGVARLVLEALISLHDKIGNIEDSAKIHANAGDTSMLSSQNPVAPIDQIAVLRCLVKLAFSEFENEDDKSGVKIKDTPSAPSANIRVKSELGVKIGIYLKRLIEQLNTNNPSHRPLPSPYTAATLTPTPAVYSHIFQQIKPEELLWFAEHAYNWAVQCIAAQEYKLAIPALDTAYTLLTTGSTNDDSKGYAEFANISLLLLGESKVEVAWVSSRNEQAVIGAEIKCIAEILTRSVIQGGSGREPKTRVMILKYESACFRAVGGAIDSGEMEVACNDVIRDDSISIDVLDGLAAVSKRLKQDHECVKLFEESLARQLRAQRHDMVRIAKQYRMIVTLNKGALEICSTLDRLVEWLSAENTSDRITEYPSTEVEWVISYTWNKGCLSFRNGSIEQAHQLMSRAIILAQLFQHLDTSRIHDMKQGIDLVAKTMNQHVQI